MFGLHTNVAYFCLVCLVCTFLKMTKSVFLLLILEHVKELVTSLSNDPPSVDKLKPNICSTSVSVLHPSIIFKPNKMLSTQSKIWLLLGWLEFT